jgi:hypothetical protein
MWWFEAFIAYSLVSATVSPSPFMVVAPPWCPAAGLDVEEEQDILEKASVPVAA